MKTKMLTGCLLVICPGSEFLTLCGLRYSFSFVIQLIRFLFCFCNCS
uniref:Uncharacterized protein n=1 Tax=Arundo donax TaxID=35708 RepID=A0A0A9HMI8_ARUDO